MFPLSPHSPQAQAIATLFNEFVVLSAVVLITVVGLVTYALLRYRARGSTNEPRQVSGSKKLEIVWTAVPLALVIALFVITVRTMASIDAPDHPDRAPDLIVTGHQWWWEARYPNGAIAENEIHIPAGRRLLVRIESTDVIHDFWVPQLARKMDAVPGRLGYIWLEANALGIYQGACAEFCGTQHAGMRFVVVAEPEAAFSAWMKRQSEPAVVPSSGAAAEGVRLFEQKKCGDCHAIAGTDAAGRSGPDLTHVASRNSRNLAQWIHDPQSVKPGNRMPDTHLSDQESQALQAYLGMLE